MDKDIKSAHMYRLCQIMSTTTVVAVVVLNFDSMFSQSSLVLDKTGAGKLRINMDGTGIYLICDLSAKIVVVFMIVS